MLLRLVRSVIRTTSIVIVLFGTKKYFIVIVRNYHESIPQTYQHYFQVNDRKVVSYLILVLFSRRDR